MSEVNADGILVDPELALDQLVRHKTNALMAPPDPGPVPDSDDPADTRRQRRPRRHGGRRAPRLRRSGAAPSPLHALKKRPPAGISGGTFCI